MVKIYIRNKKIPDMSFSIDDSIRHHAPLLDNLYPEKWPEKVKEKESSQ